MKILANHAAKIYIQWNVLIWIAALSTYMLSSDKQKYHFTDYQPYQYSIFLPTTISVCLCSSIIYCCNDIIPIILHCCHIV